MPAPPGTRYPIPCLPDIHCARGEGVEGVVGEGVIGEGVAAEGVGEGVAGEAVGKSVLS